MIYVLAIVIMIARKSLLIVISYFFTRFLGWVGLVVLAKLWSDYAPEALGIIGFALSFLAIFNIVADLGFSRAHIKRISEGKDLGTCIGTYVTIKLLLIGAMVTIVFSTLFIWKNVFHEEFSNATTESVIIVIVLYYVFVNLLQIATDTFEGRKEIAKRQITQIVQGVKTPLMIIVALAGVSTAGVVSVVDWPEFLQPLQQYIADRAVDALAMTYVFAMIVSFLVGIWLFRRYPIKKPDWALFKSYFSFALPLMLFSIVGVISFNIDKIMIGYFWTSTHVGYYFTMQQILEVITVLYIAVGTVLFPTISEYHSSNNLKKIQQTTRLAERYITMVIIPPIVLIIIFVRPVINIMLDSAFLPAASVLMILTIYIFIRSLNYPYEALVRGMNKPSIALNIGIVMCVMNIILNFLFIPEEGLLSSIGINGPNGAAVATTISVLVGFFLLRYIVKRFAGIKPWQSHTPRHIFAGLVIGGVLYFLAYHTSFFPAVHWYHLFIFAGLGLAIYLLVLFIFKEFKKQDLRFFLDILRPKEMFKYISSELKEKPKKPK